MHYIRANEAIIHTSPPGGSSEAILLVVIVCVKSFIEGCDPSFTT